MVSFTKLTYALHERFRQEGLVDNDIKEEFKPHMTLMKLKRRMIIKREHEGKKKVVIIKRIPPEVYEHFKGKDLNLFIPFKLIMSVHTHIEFFQNAFRI